MNRRWGLATVATAILTATAVIAAPQDREAGAPVVNVFASRCFGKPNDISAIIAENNADGALKSIRTPSEFIDRKIDRVAAWTLDIAGREFELIVWHRPEFKNSGIQCMLRALDKGDNIFPYLDPFKRAIAPTGLKGRKTDLPHYFLARGKLVDGRHAEARLLTRYSLPTWGERYVTLWALFA